MFVSTSEKFSSFFLQVGCFCRQHLCLSSPCQFLSGCPAVGRRVLERLCHLQRPLFWSCSLGPQVTPRVQEELDPGMLSMSGSGWVCWESPGPTRFPVSSAYPWKMEPCRDTHGKGGRWECSPQSWGCLPVGGRAGYALVLTSSSPAIGPAWIAKALLKGNR
jgi:hypothetical protein